MDNVKVTIDVIGTNRMVADRCRTTVNMDKGTNQVPLSYMRKLYLSEHSPIRTKRFLIRIEKLPSWIATHFARHNIGVTHFISTQRDDRTDIVDRDSQPQGALVTMEIDANAQAIINISRKRLCCQAHMRTRKVWQEVLNVLKVKDRVLYECCVAECVYRGFCPELHSCGYNKSSKFNRQVEDYRNGK